MHRFEIFAFTKYRDVETTVKVIHGYCLYTSENKGTPENSLAGVIPFQFPPTSLHRWKLVFGPPFGENA